MSGTIRLNLSGISQNVGSGPQRSVSQAGAQGRELSNLGQQIVRTGAQVGSVIERRRAEEARDQSNVAYSNEKVANAEAMTRIQTKYENDPTNMTEAYRKETERRQQQLLKNVTSEKAKEDLKRRFNNENQLNLLKMEVYSRTKFTENSIKNIGNSSRQFADSYYTNPIGEDEFMLDLDEHLLDIDKRDLDNTSKSELKDDAVKQMTSGIVTGYMKGGSIQDFARARNVLGKVSSRLSAKDSESLRKKIDSEQMRVQNLKAFNERQNRIAIEKQFNSEKRMMNDIFDSVVQDPNYDASSELQMFKSRGHFNLDNFVVRSKTKMTEAETQMSEDLMFQTLETLADSENPEAIRKDLIQQTLTGQISAEDAQRIMTSIDVRSDSKFATRQYSIAKNIIKAEFDKGFNFSFNNSDKKEMTQMMLDMETLISDKGLDPVFASKVMVKTRGMRQLPTLGKAKSVSGDDSTVKGIKELQTNIAQKLYKGEISKNDALRDLRILKSKFEVLNNDVPTYDEIMNSKENK